MKPNSFPTVSVADLASLSRMATGEGRRGRGRKAACAHAMKIGGEIAAHAAKEKCARILEDFDRCGRRKRRLCAMRSHIIAALALCFTPSLAAAADLSFIADEQASVASTAEHGGEGALSHCRHYQSRHAADRDSPRQGRSAGRLSLCDARARGLGLLCHARQPVRIICLPSEVGPRPATANGRMRREMRFALRAPSRRR
jgi:hypothetical protein